MTKRQDHFQMGKFSRFGMWISLASLLLTAWEEPVPAQNLSRLPPPNHLQDRSEYTSSNSASSLALPPPNMFRGEDSAAGVPRYAPPSQNPVIEVRRASPVAPPTPPTATLPLPKSMPAPAAKPTKQAKAPAASRTPAPVQPYGGYRTSVAQLPPAPVARFREESQPMLAKPRGTQLPAPAEPPVREEPKIVSTSPWRLPPPSEVGGQASSASTPRAALPAPVAVQVTPPPAASPVPAPVMETATPPPTREPAKVSELVHDAPGRPTAAEPSPSGALSPALDGATNSRFRSAEALASLAPGNTPVNDRLVDAKSHPHSPAPDSPAPRHDVAGNSRLGKLLPPASLGEPVENAMPEAAQLPIAVTATPEAPLQPTAPAPGSSILDELTKQLDAPSPAPSATPKAVMPKAPEPMITADSPVKTEQAPAQPKTPSPELHALVEKADPGKEPVKMNWDKVDEVKVRIPRTILRGDLPESKIGPLLDELTESADHLERGAEATHFLGIYARLQAERELDKQEWQNIYGIEWELFNEGYYEAKRDWKKMGTEYKIRFYQLARDMQDRRLEESRHFLTLFESRAIESVYKDEVATLAELKDLRAKQMSRGFVTREDADTVEFKYNTAKLQLDNYHQHPQADISDDELRVLNDVENIKLAGVDELSKMTFDNSFDKRLRELFIERGKQTPAWADNLTLRLYAQRREHTDQDGETVAGVLLRLPIDRPDRGEHLADFNEDTNETELRGIEYRFTQQMQSLTRQFSNAQSTIKVLQKEAAHLEQVAKYNKMQVEKVVSTIDATPERRLQELDLDLILNRKNVYLARFEAMQVLVEISHMARAKEGQYVYTQDGNKAR